MSYVDAKKAIEKKLNTLSGVIATAREGMSFTPTVGTPYQRINILKAAPEDMTQGRKMTRSFGIAQITLFYPAPVATGTTLPDAMAESIKTLFKPVQTLTEGSTKVFITDSATITTGYADGDRWVVPVSVKFYFDFYG